MASTNKTAALGLNQWVLTDPFRMEDFNEDNRKIDTAVARKSEFIKLKEITTTTGGVSQIDVDVSDIDFSAWQAVLIDVQTSISSCMRVNNSYDSCSFIILGNPQYYSGRIGYLAKNSRAVFPTCRSAYLSVSVLCMGSGTLSFGGTSAVRFRDVKSVNLIPETSGNSFDSGAVFTIWGVR